MNTEESKKNFYSSASLFLLVATLFLVILIILGIIGVKGIRSANGPSNTITVSATGEVFAVPDVATINVNMEAEEADVTDAQGKISEQSADVVDALVGLGVEEEDIKTSNYSSSPRYEYRRFDGERTLVGYYVSQTLTIKVRDLDTVGNILGALGKLDVQNIWGPNFEIDEPDSLQDEAREQAIEKAKDKAKSLAKELGVRLGKMVNFSEGGGPYPYARSYGTEVMMADMAEEAAYDIPVIPTGENQVTSTVTLTFKIK